MQTRPQWMQRIGLLAAVCCAVVSGQEQEQHTLDMTTVPACYTILHNTGPVGCHSVEVQATAPLVTISSQAELDAFTAVADTSPRSILLHGEMFNPSTLGKLQQSGRCSGVLVAAMASPPASASPAPSYPYCPCDTTTGCTQWNPGGTDMLDKAYNFPVVLLNSSETFLLKKQAKPSTAPTVYPEHVVEMRYHMDVYNGYKLVNGAWFQLQAHTQCCPRCKPDCGNSCCDKKNGFACMAKEGGGGGWEKPTCAKEGGPNSFSCIDQGTCLPLGGFNVWSVGVDTWPPAPGRKVVVAAAAMDAASMFHDATSGAAADASALIGVIAATDALRGVRKAMAGAGAASIMTALLQAEAWDHVGSRRLLHDMAAFRCRRAGVTNTGSSLCLDPLMLAPQIQEMNVSDVAFFLEVAQLPGGGGGGGGGELYVHSGCDPSPQTAAVTSRMLNQAASANASKVLAASSAPLPPPSALGAAVRESEEAGVAGIAGALLAGYDSHFRTPYFHSHWDAPRTDAPPDIKALCSAATAVARSLYVAAHPTPTQAPASLTADCGLVGSLAAALLDPTSPTYKGPSYTGVYLPPTRRGPSAREKFIREQLALASRGEEKAGCDCCDGAAACAAQPYFECLKGECVHTVAVFHDAYPLGLAYVRNRAVVANRSVTHQIWTESNWQNNVGANSYLLDSAFNEQVVVAVGAVLTLATAAVTTLLLNYYNTHFKQN